MRRYLLVVAVSGCVGLAGCDALEEILGEVHPATVEGRYEGTWTFLVRDTLVVLDSMPRVYDSVTCGLVLELRGVGDTVLPNTSYSVRRIAGSMTLSGCTHRYGVDPDSAEHGPLPPRGLLAQVVRTAVRGWTEYYSLLFIDEGQWGGALRLENASQSYAELLGCESPTDSPRSRFAFELDGDEEAVWGGGGSFDVLPPGHPFECGGHRLFVEVRFDLPRQTEN